MLLNYGGHAPVIGKNVFLAPGSHVIGHVTIGDGSSVWFNCVLRGDVAKISIGEGTNIQDGTVIHGAEFPDLTPVEIGNRVIIGHNAVVHACTIGDGTLIGMGAIILNRARVGAGCIIGAGSVVTQDKEIPPGMLAVGNPARVIRELTAEQHRISGLVAAKYSREAIKYIHLVRAAKLNGSED
ncbi:2,3,4,5-tetrahydropyridine-2,6-dicarboxylate N-acetyltransferase [Peptococcaceae bacterium CEB3]|nr:2,3,4,5-tetrahydropyridine-2,6-dicarboxylate N-acetyltransferase [Peptococcaceae bacterium CEB3]